MCLLRFITDYDSKLSKETPAMDRKLILPKHVLLNVPERKSLHRSILGEIQVGFLLSHPFNSFFSDRRIKVRLERQTCLCSHPGVPT